MGQTITTGFGISQRQLGQIPPGPPFAINSADNGLSVDPVTRRIVLGNNTGGITATLLSDREIPLNGKTLLMSGANMQLHIADGGAFPDFFVSDGAGNNIFQMVPSLGLAFINATDTVSLANLSLNGLGGNPSAQLGASGVGGGSSIQIFKNSVDANCNPFFNVQNAVTAGQALKVNTATLEAFIGDVGGIANNTLLTVDDVNQIIIITATNGVSVNGVGLNVNGNLDVFDNGSGGFAMRVNATTLSTQIGDVSSGGNGTLLAVDDAASLVKTSIGGLLVTQVTASGLQMMTAASALADTNLIYLGNTNMTGGLIFGSTPNFNSPNGPFIGGRGVTYAAIANQRGLLFLAAGDPVGAIGVEGSIQMSTQNIGRFAIKYDGTINISNVQNFATNALALAGGLVIGDLYRTAGAVMIVI